MCPICISSVGSRVLVRTAAWSDALKSKRAYKFLSSGAHRNPDGRTGFDKAARQLNGFVAGSLLTQRCMVRPVNTERIARRTQEGHLKTP